MIASSPLLYASVARDAEAPLSGTYQPTADDVNLGEGTANFDAARQEERERLTRLSGKAEDEPGEHWLDVKL